MRRSEFLASAHLVALGLALVSLGFLSAQFLSALRQASPLPVVASEVPDGDTGRESRRLPVIALEEIRGGKLQGRLLGRARLFVGREMVRFREDGTFAVNAGPLLKNVEEVFVPPWARFVASRRGRKYYDVTSSEAERLVPENRIYFRSAEEAEAAGYSR